MSFWMTGFLKTQTKTFDRHVFMRGVTILLAWESNGETLSLRVCGQRLMDRLTMRYPVLFKKIYDRHIFQARKQRPIISRSVYNCQNVSVIIIQLTSALNAYVSSYLSQIIILPQLASHCSFLFMWKGRQTRRRIA